MYQILMYDNQINNRNLIEKILKTNKIKIMNKFQINNIL